MAPLIIAYHGITPRIGDRVYLAPGSVVAGDVTIGAEASVWFGSVLRGDVNRVEIGARTNIQDGCVLHVTAATPLTIGIGVTVGHGVILHGCSIGDGALIGMGARLLDGVTIGSGSLVAAGSLLPPGTAVPAGVLAMGSPARIVRPLTEAERREVAESAEHYVGYAASYLDGSAPPHSSR